MPSDPGLAHPQGPLGGWLGNDAVPSSGIRLLLADSLHDGAGRHLRDAAVAVAGECILAAGARPHVERLVAETSAPILERRRVGGCLCPGFVDPHVHLLRAARDAAAVDCRNAATVAEILAAIAARAALLPPGAWVDGAGYHEDDLAERRHPTRAELDEAGGGRPVRLRHRSGHAVVLSSAALRASGIDESTPDPPGGRIVRDPTGRPTGLLLGRAVAFAHPPRDGDRLAAEVTALSRGWLRRGITTVCDAGPENDGRTLATIADLQRTGRIRQRVVLMRGLSDASGPRSRPWTVPADLAGRLWPGPVKVMVWQGGGTLDPAPEALEAIVRDCARRGLICAVHAASAEAVAAAIAALHASPPPVGRRHRIEHASVLPDPLLAPLRESRAAVVTHPLFVARHGDRYLARGEDPPEWLYRCRALLERGIRVAAGSDAPVVDADPLASIAAAVDRRTTAGAVLGPLERVEATTAIALHTGWAASACGLGRVGRLASGWIADLVALSDDPADRPPARIADVSFEEVWLGGRPADISELLPCSP